MKQWEFQPRMLEGWIWSLFDIGVILTTAATILMEGKLLYHRIVSAQIGQISIAKHLTRNSQMCVCVW